MKTIILLTKFLLMFAFSTFFLACVNIGTNLHPQPLTPALLAKSGPGIVQEEWLLGLPTLEKAIPISLKWLNTNELIYTLSSEKDPHKAEIEILNVTTKVRKKLGDGLNPKPSPNGQWIAFVTSADEKTKLWVIKSGGENKKLLFEFQEKVIVDYTMDFAWSSDSNYLAVSHQQHVPFWEREVKPKDNSSSSAMDADHLSLTPPMSIIDVIDIKNHKSRHIASIDASVRNISWLPNSQDLIFMTERPGFYYADRKDQAAIQLLALKSGEVRTLATFQGMQQSLRPVASPNGQKIAFMYDADNPEYNYSTSIGLVLAHSSENQTSPILRLTHELKLSRPQWSNDGQKIYVLRDYGAYRQIYAIDANSGQAKQVTDGPRNIFEYALSPDGSKLAWVSEDAHSTNTLSVADSDGKNLHNLVNITNPPSDMALSEVQEVEWSTVGYPASMRGLLLLPLNYREGTRYPLIVDIHGGGPGAHIYLAGGILVSTPLEWQLWAAKGYAVFVPELRSSASFGSLAITRDQNQEHDLINRDVLDVVSGVDSLISSGIVDDTRMAVIGHSAGGRRANWLLVSTHRFKAIVSKEGWADEWFDAGIHSWPGYKAFGGSPSQKPEYYQKNSSLFHAKGTSTPVLFLMGNAKLGGSDTYDTVRWLYNAIKEQGVETQYIQYPDEGHVFERTANRKDALRRTVKWIETHLGQNK